ncbi:MAG: Asp-tRNA(Asn)/Glu-tRNA(Gln) amidotransferase subunit GatC [bacterium]
MITREEVDKLANLARLDLTDSEKTKLQQDMESILAYVDQLSEVQVSDEEAGFDTALVKNVMREDDSAYERRSYTEKIAEQFPARSGDYLKVKQILGGDDNA